ncbi:excinuclease ABC subunit UvrA [Deferrisoma sp.]
MTRTASSLRIVGARQNNLRNLTLAIPHDRFVVVTGVSGSGKSSLAFDTVFAEGQWRFLESLPAYARLLSEKSVRPAVDAMENVRPAVALEQRNTVRTARSTLGTATELYDLFRLLYAAAGEVRCPACGEPGRAWTPEAAAVHLEETRPDARVTVEVPLGRLEWLPPRDWRSHLLARGFARVRLGDDVVDLEDPGLPETPPEDAALVIDRLRVDPDRRGRIVATIEQAYHLGSGTARVRLATGEELRFGAARRCHRCDRELPEPRPVLFSFNHSLGACPTCTGFGAVLEWDEAKVVPDPARTLREGAVEPWQTPANRWWQDQLLAHAPRLGLDLDTPWAELPAEARRLVWEGGAGLEGIREFFEYLEGKRYKMHVRVFLARYRSPRTCPACQGARLNAQALSVTVDGRTIAEASRMDLASLGRWVRGLGPAVGPRGQGVLWRIEDRIGTLVRLGLHYLTMDRPTRTLSGGEAQRAALALQLQNHLAGTLYVLDEPTVGLHPRDVDVLAEVLRELAGRGNTVLAVEHDLSLIRRADWAIEMGPGGGREGGRVVFQGTPVDLARAPTPTGRALGRTGAGENSPPLRPPRGFLVVRGCRLHNLKDLEVRFPLGVLAVVTGVSGSGKSTLVAETLYPLLESRGARGPGELELPRAPKVRGVRLVDQSPMGRTPRSVPLTYVGAYKAVRDLFAAQPAARRLGLTPAHFSFNAKAGRCETCGGTGYEQLEMYLFEDLYVPCSECAGRRFRPEVLTVRYRGRSIHDVLGMSVDEALEVFGEPAGLVRALRTLERLGLGYLVLGQPAPTLSGGEAQRLKIAAELLGRRPKDLVYLLDEPTTGLHPEDVGRLLAVLGELVDAGNTVVAVEHNLEFIARADWVIDLGPEGGDEGGRIVDTGPPAEVARRALGPTGRHLSRWLGGTP